MPGNPLEAGSRGRPTGEKGKWGAGEWAQEDHEQLVQLFKGTEDSDQMGAKFGVQITWKREDYEEHHSIQVKLIPPETPEQALGTGREA